MHVCACVRAFRYDTSDGFGLQLKPILHSCFFFFFFAHQKEIYSCCLTSPFAGIKACMDVKQPVPKEPYEIHHISLQACVGAGSNGPKKGRFRVMKKAPKIFSGLSFYFGGQFMAFDRTYLEDLVVATGGIDLKKHDLKSQDSVRKALSSGPGYIVYSEVFLTTCRSACKISGRLGVRGVMKLHPWQGLMVIGHFRLLDTIATCSSSDELMKVAIK